MDTLQFRLRIFIVLFFANMLVGTFGFMFIEGISHCKVISGVVQCCTMKARVAATPLTWPKAIFL